MMRLIEEIDVGGAGENLWVEPVHYTSPSELAAWQEIEQSHYVRARAPLRLSFCGG
jgi:hypothetical protein